MRLVIIVPCIVGIFFIGFAYAVSFARKQAQLQSQRQRAEWRQKAFELVKSGDEKAWVMDSKLLPMLASDPDCRQIVKRLEFTSTDIDATDSQAISELTNVSSMMFYCTRGTKDLLLAARTLPIDYIYFEMPDLRSEEYLILKEFPSLKHVRFEHVMDDEWIKRLESELTGVAIDAPFPQSKQAAMEK